MLEAAKRVVANHAEAARDWDRHDRRRGGGGAVTTTTTAVSTLVLHAKTAEGGEYNDNDDHDHDSDDGNTKDTRVRTCPFQ